MSISNIIDPTNKKIYPSLILGGGGAGVESLNVKVGIDNVGTATDPIIGLSVENLGDLLVGNGTPNEAVVLPKGTAGQVLKVNVGGTDLEWANESVPTAFSAEGQILYGGPSPFNPVDLNIGTAGQFLKVNTGATAPEWANGSSGGLQDGFGLYLSTVIAMTNQNDDAPDNGPDIPFTGAPAPLTSGICSSLVIDSGGGGNPVGLRWTGTNPIAIFLQADLLCQAKITAGGAPANFITNLTDYSFSSAGVQSAIKDTAGGYITPICRYLIGGSETSGIGTYESTFTYQGIMNPTDTVEFSGLTNWVFNKTGSDPAGTYTFDILLGPVNVYVCECAYPT
jgi:hypothetical protein